jgi:hypothetical protein
VMPVTTRAAAEGRPQGPLASPASISFASCRGGRPRAAILSRPVPTGTCSRLRRGPSAVSLDARRRPATKAPSPKSRDVGGPRWSGSHRAS